MEVLLYVKAVAGSLCHLHLSECGFELRVFVGSVGVLGVACEHECACAIKLCVSVDKEAGLVCAARAVGERGSGACRQGHVDALAVGNVDGGTCGVGERQAVEHKGSLVFAVHGKTTVGRGAREGIGHFLLQVGRLQETYLASVHRNGQFVLEMARYSEARSCFGVVDGDGQRIVCLAVHRDTVDLCGRNGRFAQLEQTAIGGYAHLASLFGRGDEGRRPAVYAQPLGGGLLGQGRARQKEGSGKGEEGAFHRARVLKVRLFILIT